MVPNKFKEWVRVVLFTDREEGICTHIVVRHIAGKASGDVAKIPVPKREDIGEGEAEETIALLSTNAWNFAQQDADAFQGLQTYGFHAYFAGEPDKHLLRFTHRFESQTDDGEGNDDESVSEPPTKTGLISAAMRHAEVFARIGTQATMHQLSMQQRTIESQQRLIEELNKDKLDAIHLVEDLQSKKHERDLELKEKEANFKLKGTALNRLSAYLPLVAKKLGMPMLPAKTNGKGTTPGIQELLASIDMEQFEALNHVFRPEQKAILGELMMEQQDQNEKEKKESESEATEQPH